MKIHFIFTDAKNGGFGILGKGIAKILKESDYFELTGIGLKELPKKQPDVIMTYGTPDLFDQIREIRRKKRWHKFKHAHYWVWESSRIPNEFVTKFRTADLLITSNKYHAKAARWAGLKNIQIWHHAVDDRFKYIRKNFKGTFTFLHYNGYEYRKGTPETITAFTQEFGLEEDVKLIIKARERTNSVWLTPKLEPLTEKQLMLKVEDPKRFVDECCRLNHPQIEEVIGHVSDEEMVNILKRANCFVFPAKGEGWGLPPFEAIAMGIVPIMPKYSCFSEWFDERFMLEVKSAGYLNTEPRYTGYMYQPSIKSIRKQMRWAFEHRDELKKMGKEGSKFIHKNYNWNKIHNDLVNIFKSNI